MAAYWWEGGWVFQVQQTLALSSKGPRAGGWVSYGSKFFRGGWVGSGGDWESNLIDVCRIVDNKAQLPGMLLNAGRLRQAVCDELERRQEELHDPCELVRRAIRGRGRGALRALGGQVADTRVVELELPLQALDAGAGLVAGHSGGVSMGGTVAR